MRTMVRNERQIYYCLYDGRVPVLDEYGNETGCLTKYRAAVPMRVSVSAAQGLAQSEIFGTLTDYSRVVITCDTACPIDENTVLFVDKNPEYDSDGNPRYDYIVRRAARSLNTICYAIQRVEVS